MSLTAIESDGTQICDITARAGVFNKDEIQSLSEIWEEYRVYGPQGSGYYFIIEREGNRVLGYACYGPRDFALAPGIFDLYWIAVDPNARRGGIGRKLITASEEAARQMGGRIIVAETSGTPLYESTRKFYLGMGYTAEARIKDFYAADDDLVIFTKRL